MNEKVRFGNRHHSDLQNRGNSLFKKWSGIIVIAACFLIAAGCGNSSSKGSSGSSKSGKLHVVTTFYPMYEFTKQIVKDKGDVDILIPSSVEPHDWEPTPKDIAKHSKRRSFRIQQRIYGDMGSFSGKKHEL